MPNLSASTAGQAQLGGMVDKNEFFEFFSKKGVDDRVEIDRLPFLLYGCEKESFPADAGGRFDFRYFEEKVTKIKIL